MSFYLFAKTRRLMLTSLADLYFQWKFSISCFHTILQFGTISIIWPFLTLISSCLLVHFFPPVMAENLVFEVQGRNLLSDASDDNLLCTFHYLLPHEWIFQRHWCYFDAQKCLSEFHMCLHYCFSY